MNTGLILVAAGRGTRMGGADKGALALNGRSALSYSLAAFAPLVHFGVVVVASDRVAAWQEIRERETWPMRTTIVAGGSLRQDSVRIGFDTLSARGGCDIVVIHDGARPLVTPDIARACIEAALREGAAILAVPVTDTIKRVADGRIVETLDRTSLWAAQTPQAFRWHLLRDAFTWSDHTAHAPTSDEAGLVEAYGHPVCVVRGARANIKVTAPEDVAVARALLNARVEEGDA